MKKNSIIKLLILIIIIIMFFYFYNLLNNKVNSNSNNEITETIQTPIPEGINSNTQDIIDEKITDINVNEINTEIDTEKIKEDVLNYLGDDSQNIGLYYYDINSGKSFEINKDIRYRSASTAKLFTILCLYDYVHNNEIDINEQMYYISNDYEGGTGIMQGMDLSRPYTLKELADYSILHSDNIAFNMILRRLGYNNVINYYENIIDNSIEGVITMSAYDGYKLLKKLYDNENNNPLYDDLLNNLKNTDFKNRIEEHLPIYSVAHKIGSYDSYIHDIGIIYCDNPYILTVFTNGLYNAEDKIGDVSKIIYDYNK